MKHLMTPLTLTFLLGRCLLVQRSRETTLWRKILAGISRPKRVSVVLKGEKCSEKKPLANHSIIVDPNHFFAEKNWIEIPCPFWAKNPGTKNGGKVGYMRDSMKLRDKFVQQTVARKDSERENYNLNNKQIT